MTTVEMILALVATGKFTLPEGVFRDELVGAKWWGWLDQSHVKPELICDLCAMHFARETATRVDIDGANIRKHGVRVASSMRGHMEVGDSESAIRALWEAARPRTGRVCHLSGYDPMIAPRCPACKELEETNGSPVHPTGEVSTEVADSRDLE